MSVRTAVRTAVQAYLDPSASAIPYLGKVYAHPAKFSPEGDFFENTDPGHSTGAVMYLYLQRQSERRMALGGPHSGKKATTFDLVLDCFIRSTSNLAEDCGEAADAFLDALVDRIRADRNAGDPSVIFQWGEGSTVGGTDIEVEALYPRTIMGAQKVTQVYASVRLTVLAIETI